MADGQPTYSQTLVSYIDILGFADLIKDSQTSTDGVREIIRLLTTMKDEFSIGGRVHRRPDGRTEKIFQSFNFSDLIVRTTRIPAGADIGQYFLDYLFGPVITGLTVPADGDPRPQVGEHRKMIEDKIQNEIQQKDERTRQKYRWLALYHNAALRRLIDRIGSQANHLLPNA